MRPDFAPRNAPALLNREISALSWTQTVTNFLCLFPPESYTDSRRMRDILTLTLGTGRGGS